MIHEFALQVFPQITEELFYKPGLCIQKGVMTKMKSKKESQKRKINKQNKKEKNKGITLIGLIVTIIILLILAAVSLTAVAGQNRISFKSIKNKEQACSSTKRRRSANGIIRSINR